MKINKNMLLVAVLGITMFHATSADAAEAGMTVKILLTTVLAAVAYPGMELRYVDVQSLRQGGIRTYRGSYNRGVKYLQLVQRDNKGQDVDIAVFDGFGNQICKDVDVDSSAGSISGCMHTPKWTGRFAARVGMYKGSGWYGYAVMYRR